MRKYSILLTFLALILISDPLFASQYSDIDYDKCNLDKESFNQALDEVKNKNPNAIRSLAGCLRVNHKLIFQACLIDPSQLQYSEDIFKDSEIFVKRLLKIYPETLKYASKRLRNDRVFVKRASFIYRDALKFASDKLRNNYSFMREMIESDSRNYIFGSKKIKLSHEHAALAFKDNGALLMYAPDKIRRNKKLVKIALNSSLEAYAFIDPKLKLDKEIKKLYKKRKDDFSKEKLESYLKKHYLIEDKRENIGYRINTDKRIFKDNVIIDRKYVTKWHRTLRLIKYRLREKWQLIEADNRNHQISWKEDFKEYPELIKKIERFFLKRFIDQDTIDSLYTVYLWKVRHKPETVAFKLYLLRPSEDVELEDQYVNITSLTAIASKSKSGWKLSVIQVFFDNDVRANIAYKHGHKRYEIQDLYLQDEKDKYPKIIFLVEDKLRQYFEIYGKNIGDKYHLIYRLDPLRIEGTNYQIDDPFKIKRTREEQEEYEWQRMMDNCLRDRKCAEKLGDTSFFDEEGGV